MLPKTSALVPFALIVILVSQALAQKTAEIPVGTVIKVRITDNLNSGKTQTGDTFHGTLDEPIEVNGKEVYPRGADVTGRVADVKASGRLSEPGELDLVLATIASGNRASSVETQPLVIKGESHAKSNVTKIGGGAALGAIIGGIAGGGKGAAIGTAVGAGAGTAGAAATGKREAVVESEAILSFTTAHNSPVNTGAAPAAGQAAGEAGNRPDRTPDRANEPVSQVGAQTHAAAQEAEGAAPESLDYAFTARDRRVIRNCVAEHASDLPAGITQREELPSGNERQIRSGGTLSADTQKKAQALPLACEQQLPKVPSNMERVIYNGRVLLINDANNHIVDMFYLDETR
jgi:hypothetical protein